MLSIRPFVQICKQDLKLFGLPHAAFSALLLDSCDQGLNQEELRAGNCSPSINTVAQNYKKKISFIAYIRLCISQSYFTHPQKRSSFYIRSISSQESSILF